MPRFPLSYLAAAALLIFFFRTYPQTTQQSALLPPPARPPPREKFSSLHFIHIPKCGTSFIITMRNYLDACTTKGYSCPGISGGFKIVTDPDGSRREVPVFKQNYTELEGSCNGALPACEKGKFHASWNYWGKKPADNVVTMLRTPLTRLISHWHFKRWWDGLAEKDVREDMKGFSQFAEGCASNPPSDPKSSCHYWVFPGSMAETQIKMLAGINQAKVQNVTDEEYELARHRLFKEAAFFGITEMWTESVCTFHCELGGETDPSELLNSRDNGKLGSQEGDDNLISPAAREFLDRVMARENQLYSDAKAIFIERARRCGCLNP